MCQGPQVDIQFVLTFPDPKQETSSGNITHFFDHLVHDLLKIFSLQFQRVHRLH